MNRSTIHVLVQVSMKPERREDVEAMLRRFAAEARMLPGCERMEVLQDETDPDAFVVLQEWESHEAMASSFQRLDFKEASQRLSAAAASPPSIRTCRRIT